MGFDTTGGLDFTGSSGGMTLEDNRRLPRLFKITGGTNPYTATEVTLAEVSGLLQAGTYSIAAASSLLWESNGVATVKAGTIVEAQPNSFGTGFYFTAPYVYPARVVIGLCVIKDETGDVTDIQITYSLPDGSTECELALECPETGCDDVYYCVDGAVVTVAAGDPAPDGYSDGPATTPEALTCGFWCCTDDDPPELFYVDTSAGEVAPVGCTGEYATVSEAIAAGCLDEPDPPTGEYWYCIESFNGAFGCTTSPNPLGTISITGPYGSIALCNAACEESETVTVSCCVDPVPTNLTLTISGGGGSYPITYVSGTSWATGEITVPGCGVMSIEMHCSGGVLKLFGLSTMGTTCDVVFDDPTSGSTDCDPLLVTNSATITGCSCGSKTFTVAP